MLCLHHLPGIVSDSLVDATFAYGLFKIVLLPSQKFVNILLITLNIIVVVVFVVILGVVQAHTHYSRSIKGQLSGVGLSVHSGFQESNLRAKLA